MQPFFVPYSSLVCPANVQTVEEPSPDSKTSIFLYLLCLFVALVSFACRRRIAASPRSWPIIGFLVLLSVGGVYAINASTTTEDLGWYMNTWRDHPTLIIIILFLVAVGILTLVFFTCDNFWMERRNDNNNANNNRNAVHPQVNVGYVAGADEVNFSRPN